MTILKWILGVLMVLAVVFFGLQILASETGEVVVLYTEEDGKSVETRLWVVDDAGHQWLRAGSGDASGWYQRLQTQPRVALERDGVRRDYLASAAPEMTARVNELMQQKYGWRDDVIAVLAGSRDDGVAVRLAPMPESSAADGESLR